MCNRTYLIMTAKCEVGTTLFAIEKSAFRWTFLSLVEVLRARYSKNSSHSSKTRHIRRLFSLYKQALKGFYYESNKERIWFFVATQDEALERLTR